MATVLHIDCAARLEGSYSRVLSGEFIEAWREKHPDDRVVRHDLARAPVPPVDEAWLRAAFIPPETATEAIKQGVAVSDALIDEFVAADRYVFGVPVYNLNVPSTFKAYVDQIVRAGRTFEFTEEGPRGLVSGKKMLVFSAAGGYYGPGSPMEGWNHHEPWLRAIFGLIGVTDIEVVSVEGTNFDEAMAQRDLAAARERISQLAEGW